MWAGPVELVGGACRLDHFLEVPTPVEVQQRRGAAHPSLGCWKSDGASVRTRVVPPCPRTAAHAPNTLENEPKLIMER